MSDADFEAEEVQKRIDVIYKSVVQQFKKGNHQEAANTLKRALGRYPNNEKLQGLLSQLKLKVRDNRIRKLENEAMILIQKGAGDEGQKKLREILKLDPTRTDLKESLRKLRAENQEEYYSDMRKQSVRKIALYIALFILFVVTVSISAAAWSNRRKLKNAKEYISSRQYESAIVELNKCGWFMAGEKSSLYDQLLSIKETLKGEAAECAGKKEYAKAIQLLQTASKATIYPDEFSEEIERLRKVQKAELKAKAEAEQAKYDCEIAARKAHGHKPKIETSQLMSEAKKLSDEARTFSIREDFIQARQRWGQATRKYNEAALIAIRIDTERKNALLAKEECHSIRVVAQKSNAEIEAQQVWGEATSMLVSANKQFEERQFSQAKDSWHNATAKYTEALEISRRSPSFLKAQQECEKWKNLKAGMTESSVRNVLGAPNYALVESDRCTLFYQEIPRVVRNERGKMGIVNPGCGYIHLANAGFEIALGKEKKKYEKAMTVQDRRYKAEIRKVGANPEANAILKRLKSLHEDRLKEIEQDYSTRKDDLRGGLISYKPIYFVSQWSPPNPDEVASLLVSPQEKQGAKTDAKWELQSNWGRLTINMEQRNVMTILGPSGSANVIGREIFRYGNVQGYGELEFTRRRDDQMRLSYWREPLWTEVFEDVVSASNSGDPNSL